METLEDYNNGNGIIYEDSSRFRVKKFKRKDDTKCFINYELNETTPVSIYIDIWSCFTTIPLGSGRILMKDFFEFMKKKNVGVIDDNTVVSLTPTPNVIENPRIPKEKRTVSNLVGYYKSINFDKEYVQGKDNYLSGTIGNIIRGITDYKKNGGRRKTKRSKKSNMRKSKRRRY
jgi:hypothetical protein